jgi:hypothetical protein
MIDKLELRVPSQARFSHKFGRLYKEICNEPKVNPFHPSQHYQSVADLRPFGHDVVLHSGGSVTSERSLSRRMRAWDKGRFRRFTWAAGQIAFGSMTSSPSISINIKS